MSFREFFEGHPRLLPEWLHCHLLARPGLPQFEVRQQHQHRANVSECSAQSGHGMFACAGLADERGELVRLPDAPSEDGDGTSTGVLCLDGKGAT